MTLVLCVLLVSLLIGIGWVKRPRRALSETWLLEQQRREGTAGWDGPRWTFPGERDHL